MYSTSIIGGMHIRSGKGLRERRGWDGKGNSKKKTRKCDEIIDASEAYYCDRGIEPRKTNVMGSGRRKTTTARVRNTG